MKQSLPRPRFTKRKAVKLRTNGKHKVDAASTISAPVGMQRILRPQSYFRWLGPQLAAITPQYIEQTVISAMAGNHIQQWALFDLMLKTWPELLQCYQELILGVTRKKLIFEPAHEENEKPTPSAIERMQLVSTALRSLTPDPTRDDNEIEGTIKDILDAWFRGVAVLEIVWQMADTPNLGTIAAPQCTFSVDPTNYAFSNEGVLGLRTGKRNSNSVGVWPYQTTSLQPEPSDLAPFPENKFLIAKHKASAGNPIGGALLRPLAWWWCAANFSSDWLLNLAQVFGLPFRWASYDPNCTPETLAALDQMLQNMGSAGWARFPTPTQLEFVEMGKQGSDHSPQGELLDRADRYARNLILGQTMTGTHGTTGKGGGQAFGEVEADVKSDRIDAAGKFAADIINQQLVTSILILNYGDKTEAPTVRFLEDEEAGLAEAQRDQVLIKNVGLEVSEAFIRKKYGLPEPEGEDDTLGGEPPPTPPGFGLPNDGSNLPNDKKKKPNDNLQASEMRSPSSLDISVVDNHIVRGYMARIQSGEQLPPCVLRPDGKRLKDGNHRAAAYKLLGRDVPCISALANISAIQDDAIFKSELLKLTEEL